jgi:hypothetical protein
VLVLLRIFSFTDSEVSTFSYIFAHIPNVLSTTIRECSMIKPVMMLLVCQSFRINIAFLYVFNMECLVSILLYIYFYLSMHDT